MKNSSHPLQIAIAWCLAWGEGRTPQFDRSRLQSMRQALNGNGAVPEDLQWAIDAVQKLEELPFPKTLSELKQLAEQNPVLWDSKIGLVYGGATKIKQYVFEASTLPGIRGASGLLDRINLIDLKAYFGETASSDRNSKQSEEEKTYCQSVRDWLKADRNFPELLDALIPELIIYSTGGNILAFCPAAFVDDLANAIEKRYTQETLTANSCAVGKVFHPLELRFGLLKDNIDETLWFDWYQKNYQQPLVEAYYGQPGNQQESKLKNFQQRKSFNELVGVLASLFNQRRSGNDLGDHRPLRRYPPMFETHPYLRRDGGERRSAVFQATELPGSPWFSETLIRKRLVSELAKEEKSSYQKHDRAKNWYSSSEFEWEPGVVDSWVNRFRKGLEEKKIPHRYYKNIRNLGMEPRQVDEAKSVREISNASNHQGFVAYIYADGNNMGGYIQKIQTAQEYQQFSEDVFNATEISVYRALAEYLQPHQLKNLKDPDNKDRNGTWIHPFEIITIGGDDVLLIVPADRALEIAQKIGEEFDKEMLGLHERYRIDRSYDPQKVHRYHPSLTKDLPGSKSQPKSQSSQSQLSMSIGVLITAEETPIYYAEKLTTQLLKSAKKQAKNLKKKGYLGGTIDFFVMKGVTMVSSSISEFRQQGLMKYTEHKLESKLKLKLKLYGAPYTLPEIEALLATAKALKQSQFPRSQLYQIRSLLERGKQTAILNYRYFRTRLPKDKQELLITQFEKAWCLPKDESNLGSLAPWMSLKKEDESGKQKETIYETIWRDIVDLYPFISVEEEKVKSTEDLQEVNQ